MSNSPTHLPLSNEEWEKKIYAYMAHRTESGNDPSVIYRLSHAGPGKSGYSFGSVQIDLAGMKPERQELLQAVDAWLKAQGRGGDPAWMENVTRQLSIKGDANALAGKYKKDINDYLATAEGHSLVDRLSDQTRQNMLKDRKRGIFDSPAAVELLKDSQSLAYIFKLINAGNPTRLRSFLSGKAVRLSSGVSTIPGGQGFDIEAMQGPLEGNVKGNGRVQLAGDRTLPENSDVLQSGTRIIVKKEGFFVKSPYRRFNVEDAPLALNLVYNKSQRLKFEVGKQEYRLIGAVDASIQGRRITLKGAEFELTTETQLTAQQASGEVPISPQEFYEQYANLNTHSKPYKDAVQKIYVDDKSFFRNVDAMPDMSQPVDWSVWHPLDPDNFLPFNVKPAILEEWAKDPRNKDKRPLDRSIIEEYLKTNRRIQGEMLRAVAPNAGANLPQKDWPGQASTPPMPYRAPDGSTRTISYRVKNDVVANGKRVLAEAARTPEGLAALDIAVGFGRYPSENSGPKLTVTPSPIFSPPPQKLDAKPKVTRKAIPKPSAVKPKKSLFDRLHPQEMVQPIVFGGPEPLKRPPPPAPEDAPVTLKQLQEAQDALLLDLRVTIMNRPAPEIDVYALQKKLARVDYLDALQGRTIHSRA